MKENLKEIQNKIEELLKTAPNDRDEKWLNSYIYYIIKEANLLKETGVSKQNVR